MEISTLKNLLEVNDLEQAISNDCEETLALLCRLDVDNIPRHCTENAVRDVISLLEEKHKDRINLISKTLAYLIKNDVEYVLPQKNAAYVFENILQQNSETKENLLQIVNQAENLVAEAASLSEIAIPVLLGLIKETKYFSSVPSNEYAVQIMGSLTAYGLPEIFMQSFDNEHLCSVAVVVSQNASSYSKEDKTKIMQKILQRLETEETTTHAILTLAAIVLIEDDMPNLFNHFKKLDTNHKENVLRQMQNRIEFLPVHETILQYSFHSYNGVIAQLVDCIYDRQKKNSHKKLISSINNWGDFWTFAHQMIADRRETYKKTLICYLKSFLYEIGKYQQQPTIQDLAQLLQNAFTSKAIAYDKSWKNSSDYQDNTQQEVEEILKEQIHDLHILQEQNMLDNMDEDGIETPDGNHWQNIEIFSYLEKAIDGHEQSSIEQCRWDDVSNILLMGRISE